MSCWINLQRSESCHSVVPFPPIFPPSRRLLVVFITHRPSGVCRRSFHITRLLFLSSTCQHRIYPTRGGLILFCLPLTPCRAVVDPLFMKREPIIGVFVLAAKASLVSGARRGQAIGLLPLHDSCFALAYPYPTFHTLSFSLLTSVYTMVPVSRDCRLPFSRTAIIGRSDGTWRKG